MRGAWILAALLLVQGAWADQTVLPNYDAVQRSVFWEKVYPHGGWTFYCGVKFDNRHDTEDGRPLSIEHIVPAERMTELFHCGSRTECREASERFNHMEADLYNMAPALRNVNSSRQDAPYAMIPGEDWRFPGCDYERKDGVVEPRPIIRGNIARAMFYMHQEYGLKLDAATLDMLKSWNRTDPPSCAELRRNNLIENLQGTRNRFIDHPERADTLTPD